MLDYSNKSFVGPYFIFDHKMQTYIVAAIPNRMCTDTVLFYLELAFTLLCLFGSFAESGMYTF